MKKGKSIKLSLSRETLRQLEPAQVQVVNGGISYEYCSVTCLSGCSYCDN